jgi:uncharacterized membrane-anchored protein
MTKTEMNLLSKVPAITVGFWIIKILATTLGETAGDTISMTVNWGYLAGTALFGMILIGLATWQIKSKLFHPYLYWATIIASTTAGTTLADYATRSVGIGYAGGSALLLASVIASLAAWKYALGSVSVETVHEPKAELYYWITITFSQTLGTALGDWMADNGGMGYLGAASIFGAALAVILLLHYRTNVSKVFLFWAAFILTRPLGATVGDFLDKPLDHGGLNFSRPIASLILAIAILAIMFIFPQRAGVRHKSIG